MFISRIYINYVDFWLRYVVMQSNKLVCSCCSYSAIYQVAFRQLFSDVFGRFWAGADPHGRGRPPFYAISLHFTPFHAILRHFTPFHSKKGCSDFVTIWPLFRTSNIFLTYNFKWSKKRLFRFCNFLTFDQNLWHISDL